MSTSSPDRFALYEMMRDAWGDPLATAVIERIAHMDSSDIATKQDVENMGVLLRGEMSELRGELGGEMSELRGELRGEMSELRGELRGEMSELRGEMSELRGEIRGLRGEVLGELGALRGEFRASSRHTLVTVIASAVTVWLSFYLPHVL